MNLDKLHELKTEHDRLHTLVLRTAALYAPDGRFIAVSVGEVVSLLPEQELAEVVCFIRQRALADRRHIRDAFRAVGIDLGAE